MAIQDPPAVPQEVVHQSPWLKFGLKGQTYAVDIQSIVSISTLPRDICPLPNADSRMMGIYFLRERAVPLYDMRKLFGLPTLDDEYQMFTDMLEQRKQDHLHWAKVLEESIQAGDSFPLAIDPHMCAFGKWYDHFQTDIPSISHHLGKLDEPHKRLHHVAEEVIACSQSCDACAREECLKSAFRRLREEYVPQIVGLLDETKEVFRASFQEMAVVIERDNALLGLVVDEVLAVEPLGQRSPLPTVDGSAVGGYAHEVSLDESGERILLIDQDPLFQLLQ